MGCEVPSLFPLMLLHPPAAASSFMWEYEFRANLCSAGLTFSCCMRLKRVDSLVLLSLEILSLRHFPETLHVMP